MPSLYNLEYFQHLLMTAAFYLLLFLPMVAKFIVLVIIISIMVVKLRCLLLFLAIFSQKVKFKNLLQLLHF